MAGETRKRENKPRQKEPPWNEVIRYLEHIRDVSRPKYWCWPGPGARLDVNGPGAWAVDRPAPDPNRVDKVFCAGVIQLGRRRLGLPVTKNVSASIYHGGTRSISDFFGGHLRDFHIGEFRRGDLAFVPFQFRGQDDEGHVGIALGGPDDPFLQSFAWSCATLEPGLNKRYTLRQSHESRAGGFYAKRIPREIVWFPRTQWKK